MPSTMKSLPGRSRSSRNVFTLFAGLDSQASSEGPPESRSQGLPSPRVEQGGSKLHGLATRPAGDLLLLTGRNAVLDLVGQGKDRAGPGHREMIVGAQERPVLARPHALVAGLSDHRRQK